MDRYGRNSQGSGYVDEFLNTKLRDRYSSLEELCQDLEADQAELEKSWKL